MDDDKRKLLEAAGWRVGDAEDFLGEPLCEAPLFPYAFVVVGALVAAALAAMLLWR